MSQSDGSARVSGSGTARSHGVGTYVAIVGGGASGTLLAARLLRAASTPMSVIVYEPRVNLGEGVAYSTKDGHHLLNVPACGMSAFPEDPDHFTRWSGASPTSFVARMRYAQYLREVLEESRELAPIGSRFTHLRDAVVDIGMSDGPTVTTERGATSSVDFVVLATGNGTPGVPEALRAAHLPSSRLVTDPWMPGAFDEARDGERVLIVGTGLTAVDVAISLAATIPGVRIDAVSRRGLLPTRHDDPWRPGSPAPDWSADGVCALDVLRYVRSHGQQWRQGLDSLRSLTPSIWQSWDDAAKERAFRHLARYWDVHRHRMAAPVARVVERLTRTGRLRVHAAEVRSLVPDSDGIDVLLANGASMRVDRVVLCTGPSGNVKSELLGRRLTSIGLAQSGPLGLGYLVDPASGTLIDGAGQENPAVLTIGPPRRGVTWESTAMPEIRQQALQVCSTILDRQPVSA